MNAYRSLQRAGVLLLTAAVAPAVPAQITYGGLWVTDLTLEGEYVGAKFGYAIDLMGDLDGDGVPDILVGSPEANPSGMMHAGVAYVFSGATGQKIWEVPGQDAQDQCGFSVAAAGDVDGDGIDDMIIGAPYADFSGLVDAGAAYVLSGADGAIIWKLQGDQSFSLYGFSVASAGDLDGDGICEIIVGAPETEVNGMVGAGSVFVYNGATGGLIYRFDSPAEKWWFGSAVANAGDVNADGYNDIVVGATFADVINGRDNAGAAAVFSGADGQLLYQVDGQEPTDMLGNAVAGLGDLNGDGYDDFAAGVYLASPNNTIGAGAVYVLSGYDGSLLHLFQGEQEWEKLGWSVRSAGDVTGDGVNDIITGAPITDYLGMVDAGKVEVYDGVSGQLVARFFGNEPDGRLGFAVAPGGDLDGDGHAEVLISEHRAMIQGYDNVGKVYRYAFKPCIRADADSVSSSAGGFVTIQIDFPADFAGDGYAILASAAGTGPTTLDDVVVPLTPDPLYDRMLNQNPPPQILNPYGTLDAAGDATAFFQSNPGELSFFIGQTLWVAAISFVPVTDPVASSVALPIEVLP